MFNILNGGKHAEDSTDFQEFMVMPVGAEPSPRPAGRRRGLPRAERGSSTTRAATGQATKADSRPRCRQPGGDRGHLRAIEKAGYRPGEKVAIALDPATTELVEPGTARTVARPATSSPSEGRTLDSGELVDLWADWVGALPDRLYRGRPRGGRLGRLAALVERLGERSSSSATTCS